MLWLESISARPGLWGGGGGGGAGAGAGGPDTPRPGGKDAPVAGRKGCAYRELGRGGVFATHPPAVAKSARRWPTGSPPAGPHHQPPQPRRHGGLAPAGTNATPPSGTVSVFPPWRERRVR